ncbi:NADPH-dependent 1-acyldihydroxyacetone phosphate reductase [Trichoderma ghanense]|uniref:NADPH-dependent 1-acyldihydroxyacetone phosphate reductase n=1 Tax=Trichoderma ghanense TaxID=65468 RepID=A0ABY2H282_9HYPO
MAARRTVLISGCSDGSLGSHLALAFHRNGWRVFASARNLSKMAQARASGLELVQLDTTDDESIAACVARVSELTGGSLDALVNNAGAGYSMPVMDLDLAQTRQLFELNVFSLVAVTRAFFPLLVRSQSPGGGLVVNNTSCMALPHASMPFSGAYNASKAAAASFSEVLRLELAPFGVRVTNLVTGSVRSTFHANAPRVSLPPASIYNVAKEAVERWMSGAEATATGADPAQWAEGVIKDLSRDRPPLWVWRGRHAMAARIGSFLPVGALDGVYKSRTGLDEVSRRLKEQGGLESIFKRP